MKRIINLTLNTTLVLLFTACTSSSIPVVPQSPSFKLGTQDGCATAKGNYTKNSDSFNNNQDYKNGWYSGRKNCNPAQVAQ